MGKKLNAQVFMDALMAELKGQDGPVDNYQANLKYNYGRYNYWPIYRMEYEGETYYFAGCCATANTDLSVIKRICARN